MQPVSFYLVTDTHFFEPLLGCSGKAYEDYMSTEQMCLAENKAITERVFREIAEDKDTNIIILPGDLSKDGEKESHLSLIRLLNSVKAEGNEIYVITARHDFNPSPRGYAGEEYVPVAGTSREELYDLYYDFGFSQALSCDRESMSYTADIAPGVRMLAVNSDGTAEKKGYIDQRLEEWIKEQTARAKEDGVFLFAINHYPIIPPAPAFSFVGDAKVKQWKQVAALLADNGVSLALTGHMHIQSVNTHITEKGNKFTDVCTSALVGNPAMYRKITILSPDSMRIESFHVPPFELETGVHIDDNYFNFRFEQMLTNRLTRMLSGGKGAAKILKKKGLHLFNTLTLGKLGRLLWFNPGKNLRNTKFKDFAVKIAINMFAGDAPYTEGTEEYEAVRKFTKRIGPVLNIAEKKLTKDGERPDLRAVIFNTIGNNKGYSDNSGTYSL